MVGEQDVLARVDARHVTVDAITARRHRAGSAGRRRAIVGLGVRVIRLGRGAGVAAGMAGKADCEIRSAVGRCPRVGIVAGHATERAAALAKTPGLEDSDRLETG